MRIPDPCIHYGACETVTAWLSPYADIFRCWNCELNSSCGDSHSHLVPYLVKRVGYSVIPFWDEMHEVNYIYLNKTLS